MDSEKDYSCVQLNCKMNLKDDLAETISCIVQIVNEWFVHWFILISQIHKINMYDLFNNQVGFVLYLKYIYYV